MFNAKWNLWIERISVNVTTDRAVRRPPPIAAGWRGPHRKEKSPCSHRYIKVSQILVCVCVFFFVVLPSVHHLPFCFSLERTKASGNWKKKIVSPTQKTCVGTMKIESNFSINRTVRGGFFKKKKKNFCCRQLDEIETQCDRLDSGYLQTNDKRINYFRLMMFYMARARSKRPSLL